MKTLAPALLLLVSSSFATACNTPKDPPPPIGAASADASKPLVATATPTGTGTATPTATTTTTATATTTRTTTGTATATTPSASASAAAGTPKLAACTGDADCRTFSSYCAAAPCACKVLGKGEGDPKCAGGPMLNCFVDPCMNKGAHCQSGACVLTAKGPAGATEK